MRKEFSIAAVALLFMTLVALPAARRNDHVGEFEILANVVKEIEDHYVDTVDSTELFYGAMKGMMSTLDPYSVFETPDAMQELNLRIRGKFGGLGIEISIVDGWLTVVTPIEGSPAYKAGVAAGDKIIAIDGVSTKNITLREAVSVLRGKPGTKVKITVVHPWDPNKPVDITITRDIIRIVSVKGFARDEEGKWKYMIDEKNKIGYVRLTAFQQDSPAKMREVLEGLLREGMQGLVLDLRYNPGGLLQAAVKIADMFISSGVIVQTRGRRPEENYVFRATPRGTLPDFPMVVLINDGSASASEILSGALQDHKRAIIVGERSFGKGSVQRVKSIREIVVKNMRRYGWGKVPESPLLDCGIKLTVARYYTPSGRTFDRKYETVSRRVTKSFLKRIEKKKGGGKVDVEREEKERRERMRGGIVPDVEVKLTPEQKQLLVLSRRKSDIIHSKNEKQVKEKENKKAEGGRNASKEKEDLEEKLKDFKDIQLEKALEILRLEIKKRNSAAA